MEKKCNENKEIKIQKEEDEIKYEYNKLKKMLRNTNW